MSVREPADATDQQGEPTPPGTPVPPGDAGQEGESVRPGHRSAAGSLAPAVHRWAPVALSGLLWIVLYRINGPVWDGFLGDIIGLDLEGRTGASIRFFCFDSVKIVLLLIGIIFVVTVLRSFMSVERTRALLGGRRQGVGTVLAALLGVITPFCSCSAVPAFIGFVAAGVPIGVTLTFLIASPMVNEIAVGLLWSMFGWRIALLYVGSGLLIAITAGWVLGRWGVERWVEPFVFETRLRGQVVDPSQGLSWDDRLQLGREEVVTILRRIWPYLLVGIALGAAIHGWVPQDWFAGHAGADNPFAVFIAVALGVPLYSNAAGVMPLVEALHGQGMPMGTLLALMMSVVALSLPEMILLRRVLRPQLIALYIAVVATGILIVGHLFNMVLV